MTPRVAVLHHARSLFPLELFHQVGGSVELVWVLSGPLAEDPGLCRLLDRLGEAVDLSGLDLDAAASALSRLDLDGIVSFVDDHVLLAAELAARLGLRYHTPEVARGLVDKRVQRQRLSRLGVPGPRFWTTPAGIGAADAAALARAVSYPLVVKPAEGSGSRGIGRLEGPEELLGLLREQAGSGYVLEEYLSDGEPGRFYASYLSVESVVCRGRASHVAFTGRFPLAPPFRETGNFVPAILDPAIEGALLEMVDQAVEALGIVDSVVHTEIKLTPDGPRLIEVNGRLGGRPPFVLRSVSEVNLFQVACRVATGEVVTFEDRVRCEGIGYWLMLQPPLDARRLVAASGIEDLVQMAEVDQVDLARRPGDVVDWREGTDSRVLVVRGRASDHAELESVISRIRGTVQLAYDLPEAASEEPVPEQLVDPIELAEPTELADGELADGELADGELAGLADSVLASDPVPA